MQYISPITLLETFTPGQADKKNFTLAKKKMLAELELHGGASIDINGHIFTKNDIVGYFDALLKDDKLDYHIMIAGNALLLRFLEHNILKPGDNFDREELHNNPLFIDWVSPYFFTSFTNFAEKCFAGKDNGGWLALAGNPILMNSHYMEEAWSVVETIIRKDLAGLYALVEGTTTPGAGFLEKLTDARYLAMLEQLPPGRFATVRDEYAHMMMECGIHLFRQGNKTSGIELLENAWRLAASRNLKDQIQARRAEMDLIERGEKELGKTGHKIASSTTLRVIIVVLLIALKFATCVSMR